MAVKNTMGVNKSTRQSRAKKTTEVTLTKTQMYDLVKRPIITEKSMTDIDQRKYTFEVSQDATKPNIKAAIEEIYGVKIENIRTSTVKKKPRTVGKYKGYKKGYKKAIVKLTLDSKQIESFEM